MNRALVVGYGSIGARHARVLRELGLRVGVVSRHAAHGEDVYSRLADALTETRADYVVVANETAAHLDTLDALAECGFGGVVLVEKPLSLGILAARNDGFRHTCVGYNLRFHPALRALQSSLGDDRVLTAQVYVGQYLPSWRPGTDYRASYSASRARGGGVLRDLSHELDYTAQLFGPWTRLAALGGRVGELEIDSDDCWAVLMQLGGGASVTLQLNYLDRTTRREVVVVGANRSCRLDFVAGTLSVDGETQAFVVDRDTTYREQHRAVLEGRWDELCTLAEGRSVMETIDAIEYAARTGAWVTR